MDLRRKIACYRHDIRNNYGSLSKKSRRPRSISYYLVSGAAVVAGIGVLLSNIVPGIAPPIAVSAHRDELPEQAKIYYCLDDEVYDIEPWRADKDPHTEIIRLTGAGTFLEDKLLSDEDFRRVLQKTNKHRGDFSPFGWLDNGYNGLRIGNFEYAAEKPEGCSSIDSYLK